MNILPFFDETFFFRLSRLTLIPHDLIEMSEPMQVNTFLRQYLYIHLQMLLSIELLHFSYKLLQNVFTIKFLTVKLFPIKSASPTLLVTSLKTRLLSFRSYHIMAKGITIAITILMKSMTVHVAHMITKKTEIADFAGIYSTPFAWVRSKSHLQYKFIS